MTVVYSKPSMRNTPTARLTPWRRFAGHSQGKLVALFEVESDFPPSVVSVFGGQDAFSIGAASFVLGEVRPALLEERRYCFFSVDGVQARKELFHLRVYCTLNLLA